MFPHHLHLLSSQETVISMLYLTRVVVIVTLSADAIPPKQCATLEVPETHRSWVLHGLHKQY